jgi:branched-chain amino acid transport system ATP-binding protein
MTMLEVSDLNVFYGAIHALHGVDFEVEQGEIVSLIGANGAGKTTTLHALSSLVKPRSGSIRFLGRDIAGLAPEKVVRAGLIQSPEGRRVFAELTVRDNLMLGAFTRSDRGIHTDLHRVYERFPRLKERAHQVSGTLSGGEQQMLAIGRALMARPKLLLLDEPSMGLAPLLVREIFSIVREINADGTTILLVEQNAHQALAISHRAYVLETGKFVLSGDAKTLASSPEVKKAYLGG